MTTDVPRAEGYTDVPADQVIVNEYEPGQGIGAHVDRVPCFGPAVAAVSLGSACVMDFISPDGATRAGVLLDPGSLSVMSPLGRFQRGRRVSVTFRTVLPARP
jgi:alkylated DNA repair dioxygenase AlkB